MASKKTSVRTPTKKRGHPQTNPASLANLKPPWRAGDPSPNPSGRPKLLGDSYKAMLARVNETDPQKRTNAELIANAALVAALGGDVSAMREIRSATEGDAVTVTGNMTQNVFSHEIIAGLVTDRPKSDPETPGANQSDSDGAALG